VTGKGVAKGELIHQRSGIRGGENKGIWAMPTLDDREKTVARVMIKKNEKEYLARKKGGPELNRIFPRTGREKRRTRPDEKRELF